MVSGWLVIAFKVCSFWLKKLLSRGVFRADDWRILSPSWLMIMKRMVSLFKVRYSSSSISLMESPKLTAPIY